MKPGRKPKPTALKLFEGNPGKRPLNEREPEFTKEIPDYPEVLDDIAIKEWERIIPELKSTGTMTIVDKAALAAYCQLYSRWTQLEEDIKEEGLTVESKRYNKNGIMINSVTITNPKVTEARLTLQQVRAFCAEFGMTPSSRSRVSVKPPGKKTDPMEKLLKNGVQ